MKLDICFGISDNYCQHCACTMASILYNSNKNDEYVFHIFTDFISDENKEKFLKLKKIRDFEIKYYVIDGSMYENLNVNNKLPSSTFFRFKAFELLNLDKYLYLDVDIVVRKDIAELYNIEVKDYYCAGVEDIVSDARKKLFNIDEKSLYFNAGVMLINLDYCKKHNLAQKLNDFISQEWEQKWNDQDILNFIMQNHIKSLDLKWNCIYPYKNQYKDQTYYKKMAKNPSILHYIGIEKPWLHEYYPHMKNEYFKYLEMTPYYKPFIKQYLLAANGYFFSKIQKMSIDIFEIKNILLKHVLRK